MEPEVNPMQAPPASQPEKKGLGKAALALIIIGVVALLAAGASAAYYFYPKLLALNSNSPLASPSASALAGEIEWNKEPVSLGIPKFMEKFMNPQEGFDYSYFVMEESEYFQVGRFTKGKYAGSELLLVGMTLMGPGGGVEFRVIKNGEDYIFLKNYCDDLSYLTTIKSDADYTIPELEIPAILTGPQPRQILEKHVYFYGLLFDPKGLQKAFTDPKWGDVYMQNNSDQIEAGAFYFRKADGTKALYLIKFDFMGEDAVPQITWNDGSNNRTTYRHTSFSGCGSSNYANIYNGRIDDKFVLAGKNSKGDGIYELKDPNDAVLKKIYETYYSPADGKKMDYEDYLKSHPVFYWQDPFGRVIQFMSNAFMPMAECGKPVIYLYPEKETEVSVKLNPQGGFTYTEPEYKNGWLVKAKPDGELTEISSGKNYPYLFWEGRGGLYETPKKGFVVAQAGVHDLLVEKLKKFNLNQKEIADFLEFWEPRMQSAPYYFVTFLGTQAMNEIAPLSIEPKPDTVIRVLMDFTPLEKPISAEGFDIKAPPRKGFTVIEWGGVLR